MKRIFLCSPYHADTWAKQCRNIEIAQEACKAIVNAGYNVFAPHLFYPQFLKDKDETERSMGISLGLNWMDACDEVWILEGRVSPGMKTELEFARQLGKPISVVRFECGKMFTWPFSEIYG